MLRVTFDEVRETKGTVRFAERLEEGHEPVIGTLNVRKAAVALLGFPPELQEARMRSLTVTIERGEVF